jgi:hypothetical protein
MFVPVLAGAACASASAAILAEPVAVGAAKSEDALTFKDGVEGPPAVTLEQPPARSNDTTPSFSGTASDTTTVSVDIYAGTSTEGEPVAVLEAQGTGGRWASADVRPPLQDGTYTALATQPSSLDGQTAVSNTVTFQIDTAPPTVTLRAPPSPSNDTTPSFSGTASESTPVTVEVFAGTRAEGNIVATVTAPADGGGWTSADVAPSLPRGKHTFTAVATQPSAIKNPAGRSLPVAFRVDTEPPSVTLAAQPSPSNDRTPSFNGTASESTQVTVEIYEGTTAQGAPVASATATPGGAGDSWASGAAAPALPDGTFTAVATQPSAIGNSPGRSSPITFAVDTSAPVVTLNTVPSPSANRSPSFSGSASDDTPVTVRVYRGDKPQGALAASVGAEPRNGEWISGRATASLEWGQYTAVATQPSSIGNPLGSSAPVTFVVAPIVPAVATEAASSLTRSSAALYASVDPKASPISDCHFEYGPTSAYGRSIECGFVSEIDAFPPGGTAAVPVFARIFGLSPATAYHFRIVAVGEGGVGVGADQTFTTLPAFAFPEEAPRKPKAASAPARTHTIGTARLSALIARQLVRPGRGMSIVTLLRSGGVRVRFSAPEAGTVVFDWDYPVPLQRGGRKAQQPLRVATAALKFHSAGTAALTLRLTRAGRRLLAAVTKIWLTSTCVFEPAGASPVRRSATFELRR